MRKASQVVSNTSYLEHKMKYGEISISLYKKNINNG